MYDSRCEKDAMRDHRHGAIRAVVGRHGARNASLVAREVAAGGVDNLPPTARAQGPGPVLA